MKKKAATYQRRQEIGTKKSKDDTAEKKPNDNGYNPESRVEDTDDHTDEYQQPKTKRHKNQSFFQNSGWQIGSVAPMNILISS